VDVETDGNRLIGGGAVKGRGSRRGSKTSAGRVSDVLSAVC